MAGDSTSTITLSGHQLEDRTFLLGNDGGFVLYLPVEENTRNATLLPIKWFGASGFGHKFFEVNRVWVVLDGKETLLNRSNQTSFAQYLDHAMRTFTVDGCLIQQTFFVPPKLRAFVMTLEADREAGFTIEPQFDMRYYQSFNATFTDYAAEIEGKDANPSLSVENHVDDPDPNVGHLDFYALIRSLSAEIQAELLPQSDRFVHRTYLKDELRDKLIVGAYRQTGQQVPDEAPIWDTYATTAYVPAHLRGQGPLSLVYSFGTTPDEAHCVLDTVQAGIAQLRADKGRNAAGWQQGEELETGDEQVDLAYRQVLMRFNAGLVARGMAVRSGGGVMENFYGIFAGNKYFLDAWKRDENISLIGLLVGNDYSTMRAILHDTWQFQDARTGRLPHIIRLGQPLVYYSSDGTLWALQRLYEYTRVTGDQTLLDDKYEMVEHFFAASLNFVKRGLLPSGGIIEKAYLWETWEDTPYTPRDGYPVEIELLWLTQLEQYLPYIEARNAQLAERLRAVLAEGKETFRLFFLDGYLADSLSYSWEPRTVLTPNGYIAFGLAYPLPAELKRRMVLLGREQLAGQVGIRSLAPRDWPQVFPASFLDDPHNVHESNMRSVGIYNYHRGIEWLWLNQFFVQAELDSGDPAHAFGLYTHGLVLAALRESGVGGLGELYALQGPLGADFQAWSMTSYLAALHAFSGIGLDAVKRSVHTRPAMPSHLPRLNCRRKVGGAQVELHYQCSDGKQTVEVGAEASKLPHYTLHVGLRLPHGTKPRTVTLNGTDLSSDRWQVHESGVAGVPDELSVMTDLGGNTTIEMQV